MPACPQAYLEARNVKIEPKKISTDQQRAHQWPTLAALEGLGQAVERRSRAKHAGETDECALARNVPRAGAHLEVYSASWLQHQSPRIHACERVMQNGLRAREGRRLG